MEQNDVNLLELLAESDELAVFETESVKQLINFKWEKQAYRFHLFSFVMHMAYILNFMFYVYQAYILGHEDSLKPNCYALLANLVYPVIYEAIQMWNLGLRDYMADIGNIGD
jgi:hypothetical protein